MFAVVGVTVVALLFAVATPLYVEADAPPVLPVTAVGTVKFDVSIAIFFMISFLLLFL